MKKIKNIYPKKKYILICEFEDGLKKKYDLKLLIKEYKIFKRLEEEIGLFEKVKVDNGGYGISWNEEIDLSAEEILEKGEDII